MRRLTSSSVLRGTRSTLVAIVIANSLSRMPACNSVPGLSKTARHRLLHGRARSQRAGQRPVPTRRSGLISDAAHFIVWKREGLLAPYVPEDVARFYPAEHKDADGQFATWRAWLSVIAYNTNLVKPEDAPKSFADLLDPKWKGKIVKAHPGYSGTIMTATYQLARDLGWSFLEKLAQQGVMQVQSASDPPKKLALGERAVQADGNEYNLFQLRE